MSESPANLDGSRRDEEHRGALRAFPHDVDIRRIVAPLRASHDLLAVLLAQGAEELDALQDVNGVGRGRPASLHFRRNTERHCARPSRPWGAYSSDFSFKTNTLRECEQPRCTAGAKVQYFALFVSACSIPFCQANSEGSVEDSSTLTRAESTGPGGFSVD